MGEAETAALRECEHLSVMAHVFQAHPEATLWSCAHCRRRFYPACPECITVGHRGPHTEAVREPALREHEAGSLEWAALHWPEGRDAEVAGLPQIDVNLLATAMAGQKWKWLGWTDDDPGSERLGTAFRKRCRCCRRRIRPSRPSRVHRQAGPRLVSNNPPPTGHTVTGLKFASLRSNEPDRVGCGGSIDGTRCSWTGAVGQPWIEPDQRSLARVALRPVAPVLG